jgi:hypothetical protein
MLRDRERSEFEADIEMPMAEFTSLARDYRRFMAAGVVNVMSMMMVVVMIAGVVISVVMMVRAMSLAAVMDVGVISSAMLVIKSGHAMPQALHPGNL